MTTELYILSFGGLKEQILGHVIAIKRDYITDLVARNTFNKL